MFRLTDSLFMGFLAVLVISAPSSAAQGPGVKAKPHPPDLHAGGFSPSEIANDTTTEVSLPGFYLTGARLGTDHLCKVVSYTVVSDRQIKITFQGTRKLEDDDGSCVVTVRTPGGKVSSWIVVDFTEDQAAEYQKRERAGELAKGKAFQARSGKLWHLKFAEGSTETLTFKEIDPDGMPIFTSPSGVDVKVAVTNDSKVSIIESGCIRLGDLDGNQAKAGQSMGDCKPPGAWTGTVER